MYNSQVNEENSIAPGNKWRKIELIRERKKYGRLNCVFSRRHFLRKVDMHLIHVSLSGTLDRYLAFPETDRRLKHTRLSKEDITGKGTAQSAYYLQLFPLKFIRNSVVSQWAGLRVHID